MEGKFLIIDRGTLKLTRLAGMITTIGVTVVLFFLIDFAVRRADPLALYGGWENPHIENKIKDAERIHRSRGRIDVIVFSSSIGLQIDVARWEEACGGDIVCYNAAMGGQRPQWANFIFQNVYYPRFRPTHLVYAVCPRDVNSRGHGGEETRFSGPFWQSSNARRLMATGLAETGLSYAESASYLFQARRHIRRFIQEGPIPQDPFEFTQANGVNPPTVKTLPANIRPFTPEQLKKAGSNPYSRFSMPDDGEPQALRDLAEFCRKNGVKFVLIDQPVAPVTYSKLDNPKEDMRKYHAGLDKLESAGIPVKEMAEELKLPNSDFSDFDHVSRRGGYKITNYIYKEVIREWFPDKAKADELAPSAEVQLWTTVSSESPSFYLKKASNALAAPCQVAVTSAGGEVLLYDDVPQGKYDLAVYSHDPMSTAIPEVKRPPRAAIVTISGPSGKSDKNINLHETPIYGCMMSRHEIEVAAKSSITLKLPPDDEQNAYLDTAFLTPHISGRSAPQLDQPAPDELRTSEPMLLQNGSFEFADSVKSGYPAMWGPYTGSAEPWGTTEIISGGHSGDKCVRLNHTKGKGWGCVLIQNLLSPMLSIVRGKQIEASIWVKCNTTEVVADIQLSGSEKKTVKLSKYTKVGEWQQLSATMTVPADTTAVRFGFGVLNGKTALFDSADIVVK